MVKILLVDDDDSLRIVLTKVLQRMGHEVRTAENGLKAMEIYRDWSPAIIITDLIMPEQEGIETIQALRAKDKTVKIIAMSGGGTGDANAYLEIAKHLGANAVLAKPFSMEQLQAAVTAVLLSAN
ncbi:MAG: response regulator [Verrucomicrobiota bacterium]